MAYLRLQFLFYRKDLLTKEKKNQHFSISKVDAYDLL